MADPHRPGGGEREFAANPALNRAIERAVDNGGTLHLLGLVSDGGVHSHIQHLVALLRLARSHGYRRIAWSCTPSPTAVTRLLIAGSASCAAEQAMAGVGVGHVGTVSGRYYAMDRDRRWERTQRAYEAIVHGRGSTPGRSRKPSAVPTQPGSLMSSFRRQ